jgi:SpoIVB peptidase S55
MFKRALLSSLFFSLSVFAETPDSATLSALTAPKSGPVALFPESDIKPGMKAIAWTVFQGSKAEPVPIEIVGVWQNAWGPKQDIIVAKMSGKAQRTNVAGGMSGSPVYIDGKLVGAVSLRLSVFSPDAICGITPIRLMLEVKEYDKSRPADSRTPDKIPSTKASSLQVPGELLQRVMSGSALASAAEAPMMTPIATPITMSGFSDEAVKEFSPIFTQLGLTVSQGGAGGNLDSSKPAKDWATSLQPGESVAAVLVSGDMTMTGAGTVTYNDGKHVLAFGHPMFNLGPVNMPLAKEEIITTLASAYQPTKMGNASEVVGALVQDRHSAIAGELGRTAQMIPVTMHVRSFGQDNAIRKARDFHFNVFVDQKWTPYLMMATLFNSLSNLNDFSEEATYRLSGELKVQGQQSIKLTTMQAPAETPIPTPMLLAGWWGDKFNRLFINSGKPPQLDAVNLDVDLLPDRRIAQIESAWISDNKVNPGTEVPVKVYLRPYRGDRIERTVNVKIPAGLARGEHQILFSDADTLSRFQNIASSLNRIADIPQTVALLNEERSNNRLYVSLIGSQPTVYSDEKVLPSLPASVLNVMQSGRATNHEFVSSPESAHEQASVPFDVVVTGNYSLKIFVN